MSNSFDKIKGYKRVKADLMQISDIMRNPDAYAKLGVTFPRGLLLIGDPGVGKTLMSKCLIEDSGWNQFICRKDKPNGEFVNQIKETFESAKKSVPAIVLLDDLDKFANEDKENTDAEEYVTVQACIDDVKDQRVFVIATVNEEYKLPDSLVRCGRFDRKIYVNNPKGQDAVEIVEAFLKSKQFISKVDPVVVAELLSGNSCAELESIINNAGLRAGFERRECIDMNDIVNAYLNVPYYKGFEADLELDQRRSDYTAVHEAGHVVASELIEPKSVMVASIIPADRHDGLTCRHRSNPFINRIDEIRDQIAIDLAGKASVELVYGVDGLGCDSDIEHAFEAAESIIRTGGAGLQSYRISRFHDTAEHLRGIEKAKIKEVEDAYRRVKEMLAKNRTFLDGIANALLDKKTIMREDIEQIREGTIVNNKDTKTVCSSKYS